MLAPGQIPLDTGLGQTIIPHQRLNENAVLASLPKLGNLLGRQFVGEAEPNAAGFRFADAVGLALGAELGFELRNSAEHIEQQASRGVARVDVLVDHLQVDAFPAELLGNPTQVKGRPSQAIQAHHHQRIAVADVVEAGI